MIDVRAEREPEQAVTIIRNERRWIRLREADGRSDKSEKERSNTQPKNIEEAPRLTFSGVQRHQRRSTQPTFYSMIGTWWRFPEAKTPPRRSFIFSILAYQAIAWSCGITTSTVEAQRGPYPIKG